MSQPICSGVMCQACPITGSTSPIATVSTASKNVALPTIIRALRCQRDSGNASIRAATVAEASVAVATCSFAGIGTAPGVTISAIAFLPVDLVVGCALIALAVDQDECDPAHLAGAVAPGVIGSALDQ